MPSHVPNGISETLYRKGGDVNIGIYKRYDNHKGMSFFDETKNFGLLLLVLSVVDIILTAVFMFVKIGDEVPISVIAGIGGIIGALILLVYAYGVYTGEYIFKIDRFLDDASSKFGVLKGFISVYAISSTVDGVFSIIGGNIGGAIISVIIAVLCIVAVLQITDDKKDAIDKVIYYVLMVLFILLIISGVISLIIIIGIIPLIEGIMLLVMLISPEVKEKFGV